MTMNSGLQGGIGSQHRYEFDGRSWMPVGDCLYPLAEAPDMADVVVGYSPAGPATTYHHAVRLPATLAVGQPRADVLVAARQLLGE
jgi:hypothetical protein